MKPEWIGRLRLAAVIAAVAFLAIAATHRGEIAAWLSQEMMSGTQSQIEQLLR